MTAIDDIAERFAGVDLQYRRCGWTGGHRPPWRARVVTSKNERSEYRVTAYGKTCDEAARHLVTLVEELDRK